MGMRGLTHEYSSFQTEQYVPSGNSFSEIRQLYPEKLRRGLRWPIVGVSAGGESVNIEVAD